MMARQMKAYLIFRAADQSLRVAKTPPRLAWDEIAFTVELTIPTPWARIAGAIVLELPEGSPPVIEVTHREEPE